ncbi:MAG: DUF2723 domain-containing protein [bacterium]|nr:DUF2723 domain-containing protein [bacterium]
MKYLPGIVLALILVGIGALYLYTAAPSMLMLDSPRFVAAMASLGVSNPAYPFFILLGHLFSYIPYGSVIFRVQILVLGFALGTLFVVYKIVGQILTGSYGKLREVTGAGLFGMLSLAFTYQFWSQAVYIEAFLIVSFIASLLIYLVLLPVTSRTAYLRRTGVMAFILGLASGTNPILVSVVPSVAMFVLGGVRHLNLRRILATSLIGLIGLIAVWAYIPIRARQNPFLNWHDAETIGAVWKLATGGGLNVYEPDLDRVNGFTGSGKVFIASSIYYFKSLIRNFPIYILPFVLGGIYYLKREKRTRELWLLGLVVATNFLMSGLYKSGNQENWFLVSWVVLAIFAGLGYFYLSQVVSKIRDGKYLTYAFFLVFLISAFSLFPTLARGSWYLTDDYVQNLYRGVEDGTPSIIFGSGDYFDAHSFYAHEVLKPKPDVTPVTDNNLYIEDWYRSNLEKSAGLTMPKKDDYKFDSEADYSKFMNDFFGLNIPTHNVYLTQVAVRNRLFPGYAGRGSLKIDESRFKLVPSGMLLQVVSKDKKQEPDPATFEFQFKSAGFPGKRPQFAETSYTKELSGVINEYAFSYAALGEYYSRQERKDEAKKYMKLASEFNPGNPEIAENNKKVQAGEKIEEATGSAEVASTPPPGYSKYENPRYNLSFFLPVKWWGEERDGVIYVHSEDPDFRLEVKVGFKPENQDEFDYYTKNTETPGGVLANSGSAKVPGYEGKSFVKVWTVTGDNGNAPGGKGLQKNPPQMLQFFLFNKDRVLQIVVGPTTSRFMKNFETVVGSVKF